MEIDLQSWIFDDLSRGAANAIEDEFARHHDGGVVERRQKIQKHVRDAVDGALKNFMDTIRRVSEERGREERMQLRPSTAA